METKDYTVTKLAGPKVAGQPAKAGQVIKLTEAQARSELLSGAIVEGEDKEAAKEAAKKDKPSEELLDIHARARGLDEAPKEETVKPAEKAQAKPETKASPEGNKAAGAPAGQAAT